MDNAERFRFRTVATADVSAEEMETILSLFAQGYREANTAYIETSLTTLAFVTLAWEGSVPAGFAFAERRRIDLPRLPGTVVAMGGICCIPPAFRRLHLFGELERRSQDAGSVRTEGRVLSAGRMAHPASFRGMSGNPTVVPHRERRATPWQQEVGIAIAGAYRSPGFDPETFVVKGSGKPVGYPVIDIEATPEEWELFTNVDRSAGDSLLGIAWNPDAPPGWLDESAKDPR